MSTVTTMSLQRSLMETTDTIAIMGKSGHGKVLADIARANGYTQIIWIDDDTTKPEAVTRKQFTDKYADIPVALGIGDNVTREHICAELTSNDIVLLTLIHPSAVVSTSAKIARGCVIMPQAVINSDSVLGEGVIVNSNATVEHDCEVGSFAHISPNAALAGEVTVGKRTHIGIGASVVQQIRIGDDVVVAAGSAVIDDVPDTVMVAGVPATIKKKVMR